MRAASQEGRQKKFHRLHFAGERGARKSVQWPNWPPARGPGPNKEEGRPMVTKLFACAVAGALLFPQASFAKNGSTATQSRAEWKQAGALPLPPIPYLETIPWLSTEETGPRQKVDQLLGPNLDTLKVALEKKYAADDALFLDAHGRAP